MVQKVQRSTVSAHTGSSAAPAAVSNTAPDATPERVLVSDARGCAFAVSGLNGAQEVALDCEGVSLSRRGRLCLVQVTCCVGKTLVWH